MLVEEQAVESFGNESNITPPASRPRLENSGSTESARHSEIIDTWHNTGDGEIAGVEEHEPFWITMINGMMEKNLVGANVLDFGCSRGGFLETLFRMKPFAHGFGIDISRDAISAAREKKRDYPADFFLGKGEDITTANIHAAFSYEVIWLLKDLQEHARFMNRILAPGGVYYAATGCHTQHPRWNEWVEIIGRNSTLPPANHSPNDFAQAFSDAGFNVSARELGHRDFVPVNCYPEFFPTVADSIRYYSQEIIVFRFEKRPSPLS